jgi:hypothetical protein
VLEAEVELELELELLLLSAVGLLPSRRWDAFLLNERARVASLSVPPLFVGGVRRATVLFAPAASSLPLSFSIVVAEGGAELSCCSL